MERNKKLLQRHEELFIYLSTWISRGKDALPQNSFVIICYMDSSAKVSNSGNDNYISNCIRNCLPLIPEKGPRKAKK